MTVYTILTTWLSGKCVGKDAFGNRYYEARKIDKAIERRRRWVVYKGIAEPTKVPPLWHQWLHYATDHIPSASESAYTWQKEPVPNLTGTAYAYYPPGHPLAGTTRKKATGDYTPWQPS